MRAHVVQALDIYHVLESACKKEVNTLLYNNACLTSVGSIHVAFLSATQYHLSRQKTNEIHMSITVFLNLVFVDVGSPAYKSLLNCE